MLNKINEIIKENKNKRFVCTHSDGRQYNFNQHRDLNQFGNEICSDEISLNEAKDEHYNMSILINKLKLYGPNNLKR